jgi:eukaryotic-like serine/threonine-protein kinase
MSAWQVPGYIEGRELGRGSSGRVVAATNEVTGRQVAIKYLSPRLFADSAFLAGFREEAELISELDVPHVVRVVGYVEEPRRGAAIVMELVDGVSLHELITRQGPAEPESALVVLKGSLLGLAAAHALGVVHRDYKPENVLVETDGVSKLTDFGVATRAGRRVPAAGTPLYMAPEQWAGQPASPTSDIYAATAVFFECLTGRPPFEGHLRQLREQHEHAAVPSAQVVEPLQDLVERGMAKDAAARPPDAAAFVAELEVAAAAAAGPDWEERGRTQLAERVAALLLLLGGGIAGGSGAAAVTTWLGRRKNPAIVAATVVVATTLVLGGIALASGTGPYHSSGNALTVVSEPTVTPSVTPSVTVQPPTPSSSATPVITIALASQPASPDAVTCGATPPTFTVTGLITSTLATDVTYTWIRGDGTRTAPQTVSAPAGLAVDVTDTVTASSTSYSGSDALQVSSPVGASASIPLTVTCSPAPSHVSSVTVPSVTLQSGTNCQTPTDSGSFTVAVVASSTAPVQLSWATSTNNVDSPGSTTDSGSQALSGSTSYNVSISASFGSPTPGCGTTYVFATVTATGSDGQSASGSGSTIIQGD